MPQILRENNNVRPDRQSMEHQIGLNNKKWYSSALTSMLSAPTVLVDYFMINEDETTYSETLNLVKDTKKAKRYDFIENFTLIERDQEDIDDRPDTERRLQINLTNKQSLVLPNTIQPKEGDHLIIKAQERVAVPYMVTKVVPIKLIDREVWRIEYAESSIYGDIKELFERTVRRYVFKFNNVGSDKATIVEKDEEVHNQNILGTIDRLSTNITETFYDSHYDVFAFHSSLFGNLYFNYYANDLFQQKHELLKYGYDKNTLFFTNIYKFDRVEANYGKSLYELLLKRKFPRMEHTFQEPEDNFITSEATIVFHELLGIRDEINAEYGNYVPKYSYHIKLYVRSKTNHLILTPLYNSGITLVDLFNTAGFIDPYLKSSYLTYEVRHPLLCQFLDAWMDHDIEWIKGHIRLLEDYYIDKDNLDDYFGAMMVLLVLKQVYGEMNQSGYVPTYAKNFLNRGGK